MYLMVSVEYESILGSYYLVKEMHSNFARENCKKCPLLLVSIPNIKTRLPRNFIHQSNHSLAQLPAHPNGTYSVQDIFVNLLTELSP